MLLYWIIDQIFLGRDASTQYYNYLIKSYYLNKIIYFDLNSSLYSSLYLLKAY